jgi:predicted  nucleic acid-binding Zn-ribbon protein
MINYAKIEKLRIRIASLREEIEDARRHIQETRDEICKTKELKQAVVQRKAVFDEFFAWEDRSLAQMRASSQTRIAQSYAMVLQTDYVGSCVRRSRAQAAFEDMAKDINTALRRYQQQIESQKEKITHKQTTIAALKEQIRRLRQAA